VYGNLLPSCFPLEKSPLSGAPIVHRPSYDIARIAVAQFGLSDAGSAYLLIVSVRRRKLALFNVVESHPGIFVEWRSENRTVA
jgi:hypothetical protein